MVEKSILVCSCNGNMERTGIWKVYRTWPMNVHLWPILGQAWVSQRKLCDCSLGQTKAPPKTDITFAKKLDEEFTDHEFLVKSYFLSCFQAKVKIENWQTYKINRVYLNDSPISMSVAFSNIVLLPITLV